MATGWRGGGRRRIAATLLAVALLAAVSACSSKKGTVHVVRRGETLYRIGQAYGRSYQELAEVNGIANPARIEVGQKIFIPGAKRQLPTRLMSPRAARPRDAAPEPAIPADQRPLTWPVQSGYVSSLFGPRGRSHHDGIDIAAEEGTPVYAAADGVVAFADRLRGYGRVIIVRHDGAYATVYAHNQRHLVEAGDEVKRGQKIATVGDSGRTTAPNLHFEVRRNDIAYDPLAYLPPEPRLAER
jgi:murein DD-endopeptidase MepM/ murein hydrolase activator NlpD